MKLLVSFLLIAITDAYLVKFFLYTIRNQDKPILITPSNASQFVSNSSETRILIHGWVAESPGTFELTTRPALFSRGNFNIIEVDYSTTSKGPYVPAVLAVPRIAEQIGELIFNLTQNGISLKTIQPIGHCIGAHISGFLGAYIFKKTGEKLSRITALDPSGPLFEPPLILNDKHLECKDADVVFVIHTSAGTAGTFENVGCVDIYPNGGTSPQPGCPIRRYPVACSHHRSWMFFSAAVAYPGKLRAAQCGSYKDLVDGKCNDTKTIDLGGEITNADKGKYYLISSKDFPFASSVPPPLSDESTKQ